MKGLAAGCEGKYLTTWDFGVRAGMNSLPPHTSSAINSSPIYQLVSALEFALLDGERERGNSGKPTTRTQIRGYKSQHCGWSLTLYRDSPRHIKWNSVPMNFGSIVLGECESIWCATIKSRPGTLISPSPGTGGNNGTSIQCLVMGCVWEREKIFLSLVKINLTTQGLL